MFRRFTGWHMLGVMVAFFGVIIAVNFTMASIAIGSFGGTVVDNSYVASQQFNGWLEDAREQDALGWRAEEEWREDGMLALTLHGAPDPAIVTAIARHPLGRQPDMPMTFERVAAGEYVSAEALPAGRWTLRLQVNSAGAEWREEIHLQ